MTYTPINWQTGDTITAEKMNKMDNGWAVDSSSQTLFSETVTTAINPEYPDDPAFGALSYSTQLTADTVVVTFGGADYTCPRQDGDPGTYVYGGWADDGFDFSSIPFCILSEDGYNSIATETGGTYAVSVVESAQTIETSADFRTAVTSFVDTSTMPMLCVSGTTTFVEMAQSDSLLYFRPYQNINTTLIITNFNSSVVNFIPTNPNVLASFTNGVFTVSAI